MSMRAQNARMGGLEEVSVANNLLVQRVEFFCAGGVPLPLIRPLPGEALSSVSPKKSTQKKGAPEVPVATRLPCASRLCLRERLIKTPLLGFRIRQIRATISPTHE